jgi:transcriptional regulatory protein LEU3
MSDLSETEVEELYHCAVSVHAHLFSFFVADHRLERREDLIALYFAATGFLDRVFKLHNENRLLFVPYYIMQMSLAAGFGLLKILNSDFAARLSAEQGRKYVLQTVDVLRKSKVWPNDLPDRFAEVLAQLWKESSRGSRSLHSMSQSPSISNAGMSFNQTHHMQQQHNTQPSQSQHQRRDSTSLHDDPLGLIVRSRKSMSVVFDCVWRWREAKVDVDTLDSVVMTNPTNPDSSTHSTPPPGMLVENPAHSMPNFNPHVNTLSMPLQLPQGLASANSFEFFDSVSWMLDTQNDWNGYSGGGFGNDFGA